MTVTPIAQGVHGKVLTVAVAGNLACSCMKNCSNVSIIVSIESLSIYVSKKIMKPTVKLAATITVATFIVCKT
jgi:hypothetical protein